MFKMGLKSKEIDHLLLRQLKQTANELQMAYLHQTLFLSYKIERNEQ